MATWVVGDIHGCYDEFQNLLSNPEINDEDTIILIGDIIDRGNDSFKMIDWAMKNISDNGKYQMILGNHEDNIIYEFRLAVKYNEAYNRHSDKKRTLAETDISILQSQYDFSTYMYEAGFETVESIKPIIEFFESLPLYKSIEVKKSDGSAQEYVIAHAWFHENYKKLDLKDKSNLHSRDDVLWSRDVKSSSLNLVPSRYDGDAILIHGHTPTVLININNSRDRLNEVIRNNNTINIDCGCVYDKYGDCGGNLAAIRLQDEKVIYAKEVRKIKNV